MRSIACAVVLVAFGCGSSQPVGDDVPPGCGDAVVDPGEQCDDGNDNRFDGCRPDCTAVDPITPQAISTVLTHRQTYAPKIPASAQRVVYISHVRSQAELAQAEAIASHLDWDAVDHVVAGDTPSGTFDEISARPRGANPSSFT